MPSLPGPPYTPERDYPKPPGVEVAWWGGKYKVDPDGVLHFRERGFFEDPMTCGAVPSPRELNVPGHWKTNPREWKDECPGCFGPSPGLLGQQVLA